MTPSPAFLTVLDLLQVHAQVISRFGGDASLRDRGLLESAAAMPQAMFDGQFLHGTLPAMAAAHHFHLCANHPFVDGNKRVAVAAAEVFLVNNGLELAADDEQLESLTMGIAEGLLPKSEVVSFYAAHARPLR